MGCSAGQVDDGGLALCVSFFVSVCVGGRGGAESINSHLSLVPLWGICTPLKGWDESFSTATSPKSNETSKLDFVAQDLCSPSHPLSPSLTLSGSALTSPTECWSKGPRDPQDDTPQKPIGGNSARPTGPQVPAGPPTAIDSAASSAGFRGLQVPRLRPARWHQRRASHSAAGHAVMSLDFNVVRRRQTRQTRPEDD